MKALAIMKGSPAFPLCDQITSVWGLQWNQKLAFLSKSSRLLIKIVYQRQAALRYLMYVANLLIFSERVHAEMSFQRGMTIVAWIGNQANLE